MPHSALLDADGRVLLLSGAAGGVGRAICDRYMEAGGRVSAMDIHPSAFPHGVLGLACDVTDERQVGAAVARTLDRFGRIDAVVHAAGVVGEGPLQAVSPQEWQRVIDINLTSAYLLCRAAGQALSESCGSVVFMGSINGVHGGSALSGPAYAAAKAGLANLARYLAKEWAPRVRVNAIAAGPVLTPMLDRLSSDSLEELSASMLTGKLIEADEVASAVAYLLSGHARSITGTTLNLSGGLIVD